MKFESPTRHVFSPAYISHISCNISCECFFLSLQLIFTFIYFILSNAQERNAYGTNRSWCIHNHQPLKHQQSNLNQEEHIFSVLKFNSSTRIIYGALAQFCVHMERSY